MAMRRLGMLTLAMTCGLMLSGCEGLGRTPFALQIQSVNEETPQEPAGITLSDPQVFKRETLVNDRLRESRLIEALLDESADLAFRQQFEPQVARDVANITALATQIRARLDPTAGAAAERAERQNALKAEIAELELQRDREIARRKLEEERARKSGGTAEPSAQGGNPQDVAEPRLPDTKTILERLEKAETRAKTLLADLDKRAGELGAKRTSIVSTPQEQFRDLQAYRAELRQVQAEIDLDDLHDYDGNALYRLQFRATLVPGRHKDKFGVSRLTFLPPRMTDEDIADVYYTWLSHITFRMNQPLSDLRHRQLIRSYGRLSATGLFDLVQVEIQSGGGTDGNPSRIVSPGTCKGKDCIQLAVAIPTVSKVSDGSGFEPNRCDVVALLRDALGVKPQSSDRFDRCRNHQLSSLARMNLQYAGLVAQLAAAFRQISDERFIPDLDNRKALEVAIDKLEHALTNRLNVLVDEGRADRVRRGLERRRHVPLIFRSLVLEREGGTAHSACTVAEPQAPVPAILADRQAKQAPALLAGGDAYAYTTSPIEHSQRISTIARSANSLEFAIAAAANLAPQGFAGSGELAFMRSAAGNVEALERAPLVVGFADRMSPVEWEKRAVDPIYCAESQAPQVGWVFGPRVRINAEDNTLELIHTVAAHNVSADISVPGWWPAVSVYQETAWIGNWHDTGRILQLADNPGSGFHQEVFNIPLPLNPSDLDGLTNKLSKSTVGAFTQLMSVRHVEPYWISACTRNVTLLINGANVWRSTKVHLGGVPAKEISVLPDMEGVAATFDLDELFSSRNEPAHKLGLSQRVDLNVWTRNGWDSVPIWIRGSRDPRDNTCVAPTTVAHAKDRRGLSIDGISPNRIVACDKEAVFLIDVGRKEVTEFLLGGRPGTRVEPAGAKGKKRPARPGGVYKVRFRGPFNPGTGVTSIPLSVTDGREIASVPVRVASCGDAPGAPLVSLRSSHPHVIAREEKLPVLVDLLDGALPVHTVRLGLLPLGASASLKWLDAQARPLLVSEAPTRYTSTFDLKKLATDDFANVRDGFVSGNRLQLALISTPEGAQVSTPIPVRGRPVFYSSTSDATARIDGDGNVPTLPASVRLILPRNLEAAFPGASLRTLRARLLELPGVALSVAATATADGNADVSIEFASAQARQAFEAARSNDDTNADMTLQIDFGDGGGRVVPLVGNLTVKKKA